MGSLNIDFSVSKIRTAVKNFKDKEIGDGKRGPFYNNSQEWIFDVDNNNLFYNAVWQAYLDACRTFRGIDTKENRTAFQNLAERIQEYFQNDDAEFNHTAWCNCFLEDVKNYHDYSNPRFGQAQKVVNMSFKYLYCCNGSEKYEQKFAKSHMPLDQFTLAWYFSEFGILYSEWSYCSEEKYKNIQTKIREKLKENTLKYEFCIWEEYKNKCVNLKEAK